MAGAELNILLISSNSPTPPNGGDRQRTALLLRALQSFANVDVLLYRAQARIDPQLLIGLAQQANFIGRVEPTPRGRFGAWRLLRPLAPGPVDRLAHNFSRTNSSWPQDPELVKKLRALTTAKRYDAIVYRYLPTALAATPPTGVPGLVDIDDFPLQVYEQRLQSEALSRPARWLIQRHIRALESILPVRLAEFAQLWVANPEDVASVPHPAAACLPNIPYFAPDSAPPAFPPPPDTPRIGFIGSLNYDVNIAGIELFLNQVWPRILSARPDARFALYGMGASPSNLTRWAHWPGVEMVGFVDNVRTAYHECAFTVAPMETGGGSKIKVPESLAYGRTCVVTPHSLRGFGHVLQHEDALLVAETPEAIANACLRLLGDSNLQQRLSLRGYAQVCEHFSFTTVRRIVESGCAQVLASAGSG